jgi:acetyl esterase/lipase
MNFVFRRLSCCLTLLCLVGTACADATSAEKTSAKTYDVESIPNVAYYDGADADKVRHKLDLFLPKDAKDYPVLVFVHGGAWRHGDKNFMGIYSKFGKTCAKHGIGVVVTNYRLSPGVQHPEHIKDVARAFAWTHKNIQKYGGSPDKMFICGHSAGGHLAALLATDERYLKAEGLDLKTVRGVIPMSGVYRIPEQSPFFKSQFGEDAKVRKDASPLSHVHEGLPPFLIIYAENELAYCEKETAEAFCKALCDKECDATSQQIKGRNHVTLIIKASEEEDPVAQACQEFVRKICKK